MAAVATNPLPFGRGRGRGRGVRNASSPAQPGPTPTVPTPAPAPKTSTETVSKSSVASNPIVDKSVPKSTELSLKTETKPSNINDLVKRMDNLTFSEIVKTVLPGITEKTAIEALVSALSIKAISDPDFGETAAKISCEVWNNTSLHYLIRNPLLKKAQEDYKKRDEIRKKNQFHGLLVYVCELFRYLRVTGKPLNFMGDAVIQLLKELIQKKQNLTDDDILYFYQELESVGFLLEECLPEKVEEIINITRQMVISATLQPSMRCRLVQLIELHASKWTMPDELKMMYEDMQQDLMSSGK